MTLIILTKYLKLMILNKKIWIMNSKEAILIGKEKEFFKFINSNLQGKTNIGEET